MNTLMINTYKTNPITPHEQGATLTFPEPLSYEFQVVENYDDTGKLTKVALQVKINRHDQYGNVCLHGVWTDVPRVKIGNYKL